MFNMFLFLLKLLPLFLYISNREEISKYLINFDSEINLVIKGIGNHNFLSDEFYLEPSKVYVNGLYKESCKKSCDFELEKNNVTIIFDDTIKSCEYMFYGLSNITEIDFSHFDFSEVKNISYIFKNCYSLENVYFGNINALSIIEMNELFYNCSNLLSINLSKFNTKNVETLTGLFYGCINLTSLDISNFDTSKVTNMSYLFYDCINLEFIDLSSFNTNNVIDMSYMFKGCKGLKYLDISNFTPNNIITICSMFSEMDSLIYLNMYSFEINNQTNTDSSFRFVSNNLKVCSNEYNMKIYLSENTNIINNCSDICFHKNIKIDLVRKECAKSCKDNGYNYEWNNICYNKCPDGTHIILKNEFNEFDDGVAICLDKNPEGYYLDKDGFYKKCFKSCEYCYSFGNETIHNCKKCKSNFLFLNDSLYKTNCYEKCENYYYFNEKNEYICSNCSGMNDKLILEENRCIDKCENDNKFEYKKICYKKCPDGTFSDLTGTICLNNYIHFDFINFNYNLSLLDDGKDETTTKDNLTVHIKTNNNIRAYNSDNNVNINDFGNCSIILKDYYNIQDNASLLVMKSEKLDKRTNIPEIIYEFYYPMNSSFIKIDMSICKLITAYINISFFDNIFGEKFNEYKLDPMSYNDICSTTNLENNTDIPLGDRKDDYLKNATLKYCGENCVEPNLYFYNNSIKCSCSIKDSEQNTEEKFDKKKLIKNFIDVKNFANILLLKCYKKVFKLNNLKKNYGFQIFIFILASYILCLLLFCFKFYFNITKKISDLINKKAKSFKSENNNKNLETGKLNSKIKIKKENKKSSSKKRFGNPPLKKKLKSSKIKFMTTQEKIKRKSKDFNEKESILEYNRDEFNELSYEDALIYDERNYCQYYCSLLKLNHIIIFSFYCNNKDYNSQIIKIFLFFFCFGTDIAINALFYHEDILHNIYKKNGKYDSIYQYPISLYSSIISTILDYVLKYLAFHNDLVLDIKFEKKIEEFKKKKQSIYKKIKIRSILFFIISFLLVSFFLFFVSCFCGVYVNSQFCLIREALMSLISQFFVIIFYLLFPSIFRICALRAKNKNKKCLYNYSKHLAL